MNEIFHILEQVIFSCKKTNNKEDAKLFLEIASKHCESLPLLDRIAFHQNELKEYTSCINNLKKCLLFATDKNDKYAIRANMAKMYNHLNDPHSSIEYSKLNLSEQNDYDSLMELAFSYYLMGDYTQSESTMRELIKIENLPENVKGRVEYNLGSYDIENGEFKKGLKGFIDIGHKIDIWSKGAIPNVPTWMGEDITGKTLFIQAEGGIGDEIINVRFVENLKQKGINPIWITNHVGLFEVFNRNDIKTILPNQNFDTTNSLQCTAMYLPILLDLDKEDVSRTHYLKPSEEYVEKWKNILPAGKKMAVKWSGNPYYDQDLHRSIPLEKIENIKFDGTKINLQLEPELFQPDMFNAGQYIKNIEDTLAIISLCDIVVTSCTSIAHMTGSLGKKGIVCPPIACYYVWLGDAVWYNSLTVIRQTKHKSWDDVFEKVEECLKY